MKESDFLDDWNKTHTSSPTYQDVLEKPQKLFYVLPTYGDVKDNERLRDDLN